MFSNFAYQEGFKEEAAFQQGLRGGEGFQQAWMAGWLEAQKGERGYKEGEIARRARHRQRAFRRPGTGAEGRRAKWASGGIRL